MQSLTYKDIIDDKIAEWQRDLKKLEEQLEKASSGSKDKQSAKAAQLKAALGAAIVQLRTLDEQETVANTMETKDKILKIFSSLDKDFPVQEDKTPFML
ncbi:MAG: hypothetical protein ACI8ZB_004213 [Desulforhopalus sp.]|jgi:hypothetical protein